MKRPDRFTDEERERINSVAASFVGKQISKKRIRGLQREFKRHTVGSVEFMIYKKRKELAGAPAITNAAPYQPTSLDDLMASVEKIKGDFSKLKAENEELRMVKTIMDNYVRGRV